MKKIQDAEAQMRSSYESAIAAEKANLNSKRESMLATGKQEAAKIEGNSEAKMQEVKDFLNEEFERTINVTS